MIILAVNHLCSGCNLCERILYECVRPYLFILLHVLVIALLHHLPLPAFLLQRLLDQLRYLTLLTRLLSADDKPAVHNTRCGVPPVRSVSGLAPHHYGMMDAVNLTVRFKQFLRVWYDCFCSECCLWLILHLFSWHTQ